MKILLSSRLRHQSTTITTRKRECRHRMRILAKRGKRYRHRLHWRVHPIQYYKLKSKAKTLLYMLMSLSTTQMQTHLEIYFLKLVVPNSQLNLQIIIYNNHAKANKWRRLMIVNYLKYKYASLCRLERTLSSSSHNLHDHLEKRTEETISAN